MDISDRLLQIVEYVNVTPNAFAAKIGVSQPRFRNYLKGRMPDFETLHQICITYVMINERWLLTGEGEMLKCNDVAKNQVIENEVIVYQSDPRDKELLKSQQNVIDLQEYKIKSLVDENIKLKTEALGFSKSASSAHSYGTYHKSNQTKE